MCVILHMSMCVGSCMYVQVSLETRREYHTPEAGVIGTCESPAMGTGKWTHVILESSKCF